MREDVPIVFRVLQPTPSPSLLVQAHEHPQRPQTPSHYRHWSCRGYCHLRCRHRCYATYRLFVHTRHPHLFLDCGSCGYCSSVCSERHPSLPKVHTHGKPADVKGSAHARWCATGATACAYLVLCRTPRTCRTNIVFFSPPMTIVSPAGWNATAHGRDTFPNGKDAI